MAQFTSEDLKVFIDSMETIQLVECLKSKSNKSARKRHRTSFGFYEDSPQRNSFKQQYTDSKIVIDDKPEAQLTRSRTPDTCNNISPFHSFSSPSTISLASTVSSFEESLKESQDSSESRNYFDNSLLKRKADDDNHMSYLTAMCRSISPIPSYDDGYSSQELNITPVEDDDSMSPFSRPRSFAVTKNTNGRITRARVIGSILKKEYAEAGSQSDLEVASRSERIVNLLKNSNNSIYSKYNYMCSNEGGVNPNVLEKTLQYLTL